MVSKMNFYDLFYFIEFMLDLLFYSLCRKKQNPTNQPNKTKTTTLFCSSNSPQRHVYPVSSHLMSGSRLDVLQKQF